jgi:glycosyltransferase involved in cell wall biosynthesis
MPKVSVIIPVYNGEKYIAQAVNSVLNQTYRDFELIVVDDGSTDRTAEILESYGDKITYIYQDNRERSAARNKGICSCSGEYLAFLDADDMWLPHKLKQQVQLLDLSPETGLVHGIAFFINESGRRIHQNGKQTIGSFESGNEVYKSLLFENIIASPTVMVRRACFDKVGLFDESMTYTEDWDMWLRIAIHYRVDITRRPLAYYRINGGSLLENWKKYDVPSGRIRVLKKARNMLKHQKDLKPLINQAMAFSYWWAATISYRFGDISKARKYILPCFIYDRRLLLDKQKIALLLELALGKSVLDSWRTIKRKMCKVIYLNDRALFKNL